MVKITVLYGHPDDPAAFERHFDDVHIPLVNAMPNLRRVEKALVVATSDGSAPPYYRVVELYFDSEEELQASRATPEGRAPGEDVPNYATGGATVRASSYVLGGAARWRLAETAPSIREVAPQSTMAWDAREEDEAPCASAPSRSPAAAWRCPTPRSATRTRAPAKVR